MSTPPPPQQPPTGPYGPPQPANPYGGGQYPQQPFPQQYPPRPYPPQPYPPQPFPQQPYPGQGPWGQPPMGPPPRKSRTGMVVWIVVGSLVGLGVLGFAVDRMSMASGAGFPKAEYRLTLPKTLLGGEFELDEDLSRKSRENLEDTYSSTLRNPQGVAGRYTSDSPQGLTVLAISGMYGQSKDPVGGRRKMLHGAADNNDATLAVPPRNITPAGSDITLSCQVLTAKQDGGTVTMPMCAWADGNTQAVVGVVRLEGPQQDPKSVDLAKLADTTLRVRAETRRPIG
ncbi:hypothetical protein [Streptomyces sp. NPDC001717]|uniref:hypothetical protein n=1 Tax=Streptomyces sp. NPDC001717 TaxID=3364604 RepID=UPI0036A90024